MSNKHDFCGKSSSIEACDYYDDTGTMVIHFTSGQIYHYPDCPKEHFEALKQAESVGKFFHQHVRKMRSVKVP